jgi:uncharacterized protein YggE
MARIWIRGTGTVYAKPDKATLTITATTVAATSTEARDKQAKVVQNVNAAIIKVGVKEDDIQSSDFSIGKNITYNRKTGENEEKDFFARNSVTVRIRDLKKVTELIDAAVSAGANGITGPNLSIEKPLEQENQARVIAFGKAKDLAELYCKSSNLKLGDVLELEEKVDQHHRFAGKAANIQVGGAGGGEPEDELMVGMMEVSKTVNVVFEAMPLLR